MVILVPMGSLLEKEGIDPHEDMRVDQIDSSKRRLGHVEVFFLTLALISMACIPPFPGFFAKYWVLSELWLYNQTSFVVLAIISSLLGVAYYVRIAGKFFFK